MRAPVQGAPRARESVRGLDEKVARYKHIEDALQKALVSAQTCAEEVMQDASEAAQLMLHEAELKARQMMNAAYTRETGGRASDAKRAASRRVPLLVPPDAERVSRAGRGGAGGGEARWRSTRLARRPTHLRPGRRIRAPSCPEGRASSAPAQRGRGGAGSRGPRRREGRTEKGSRAGPVERDRGEGARIVFGERDDLLADVEWGG